MFYTELAHLWPLISPLEDYVEEGTELLKLLRERAPGARTLLELGSGGGHVAYYLKGHFDCCLTDISDEMLENSRRLNPECRHVVGDLRTMDLGEQFDIVLVHDAIDYMASINDLQAAFDTVWRHVVRGGLVCLYPDCVAETFEAGTTVSGGDRPDGSAARVLEWTEAPLSDDTKCVVHYSFLVRDCCGEVTSYYDRHTCGVFPRATWEQLLTQRGFLVEVVTESTAEDRPARLIFLALRALT